MRVEKYQEPIENFPSFFVVGAQKSGTTSLHDWLVQQPDVCLPTIKETHFFTYKDHYSKGIEWYMSQFPPAKDGAVVGEICPDYMFFPDAPERIRQWNQNPKFIFIFRHPIDRAYSQYRMMLRSGSEELEFREALEQEPQRLKQGGLNSFIHHSYMERGKYVDQILRYKALFPNAEYLFLKFDDLVDKGDLGAETYSKVCHFVGLKSSPTIARRGKASNVASEPKSTGLRDLLYKPSSLKPLIRALIPSKDLRAKIAVKIDRWNQRPIAKAKPDSFSIGKATLDQAHSEINKLQDYTNLNLNDWLQKEYRLD